MRRVLWGLILISIRIINIHSCDINVSNRTTYEVCEDKLIWFISDFLVDAGYDSIRHWDIVPTTSGDIFFQVKTHKSESPLLIYTVSKSNVAFGPWYLTITGLFILMQLEILYNIDP